MIVPVADRENIVAGVDDGCVEVVTRGVPVACVPRMSLMINDGMDSSDGNAEAVSSPSSDTGREMRPMRIIITTPTSARIAYIFECLEFILKIAIHLIIVDLPLNKKRPVMGLCLF